MCQEERNLGSIFKILVVICLFILINGLESYLEEIIDLLKAILACVEQN